jgi:hypothetical protein
MQEKTGNKLSRASVATVLAASSVTLGFPLQPSAAITFKDVKVTDFFYASVYELANQNVINGYTDGTFRPNKNVTRGEAAKMLALALKLDVTNAKTQQFSDINSKNIYYKYIAALANKGIINGMPDGTFRPNEPVLRGAMAKMVALGYEYTLAKQLTHSFEDVSSDNFFRYHIQTLVNLGITKGTSAIQFQPNKPVTRGELATFIARANKVEVGKPTYVVDNIVGNKIYINSVGYTIGPNISKYIKAENKSALIGAYIEGTFTSNTLTAISKLTINATGTASNIYTLDGGKSTFSGDLILNGSYIRIQNWTLNGQTIVAETPRKSLVSYNRIDLVRVASLTGTGIIDWNQPTNPDDGNLNNGPDSGNLNSGTPTDKVYKAKLSPILKYIDFANSTVKNLIVEQSGSYIKATTTLPKVTIRRDVEFAEINANMTELYLEGDTSLTLYGTHNINTVYKKTYYSVFFNTNSKVKTMIVENSNGWIDLGDFFRVDKVIIPPKTTPNDIFDDYRNDNDKIGEIVDNTGEEVDRDPIENGIVPDVTKPIINSLTVDPDSNQVTATLTVNETGNYYYLILPKTSAAPTAREIVSVQNGLSGKGTITEANKVEELKYTKSFVVSGLQSVTDYVMYVVHVDDAGNFSTRYDVNFSTKDGTPPQFLSASATGLGGGRRIEFKFKPSEKGKYYYLVRETQNVDNTIKVDDVIKEAEYSGNITDEHLVNGYTNIIRTLGGQPLKPETPYVIYAVLVDESGNKIMNVKSVQARTAILDETPPFVTGPSNTENQKLIPASTTGGLTQFYMYFSEKLDKVTAENIANYTLTGTGIVNVPNQAPITPTKVEYSEQGSGSRVLITIPSLTGFVHGDTLRVTVSKNVLDMAENAFENVDNAASGVTPRNFAEYQHNDPYFPELKISKVERDQTAPKSKIYYNASKAGTVYYLVASENYEEKILKMKPEDFVAEFGQNPTSEFNDDIGGKIYLEGDTPASLNPPLTAEIGNSEFVYDYTTLNPSTFESYKIYMVLKDRSGRLSGVKSETIISDKEAPQISSFDVKSVTNDDTKAKVTLTSENEGGTVYFGYAEKYVKSASGDTYILNPAIYDGAILREFGANTQATDAQRKQQFLQYVPNVRDRVMVKGSLNDFEVTGLKPHTEYVFYYAVEDAYGNFTVKNTSSQTMIRQLYADGTKPHVINNNVVKDPFGNFVFTFNETIGRVYEDPAATGKTSLNQVSTISTSTLVQDILEIIPDNAGSTLAASSFEIVRYETGNTNSPSKLIIKPKTGVTVLDSFKVNLKLPDQNINDNTKNFALEKVINYKYPANMDGNIIKRGRLLPDTYPNNTNELGRSTIAEIEVSLGVDTSWNQTFYYAVVNDSFNIGNSEELNSALVKEIIDNANAESNVEVTNLISYGKGSITGPSDLSSVKTVYALQYGKDPTRDLNVFFANARLFFFTVDQYGNIVWAKTSTGDTHVKLDPKTLPTTTP